MGEGQLDNLAVTNQQERRSRSGGKKHIEGHERKSIALDSIYMFTDLPPWEIPDHLSYGLLSHMQIFLTTYPLTKYETFLYTHLKPKAFSVNFLQFYPIH